MTQKTPMQLVYASSQEWEEVCNSEVAYSDLAPALLSASVAREMRKDRQLAELQEKYDSLLKNSENLSTEFEQFVSQTVAFPEEISKDHYSVLSAQKMIQEFKSRTN